MARLSFIENVERECLALLRRVAAGETIPIQQVEAAKLVLRTCKQREAKKARANARIKRLKKLKLQTRAEAAKADAEAQFAAESEERIRKILGE